MECGQAHQVAPRCGGEQDRRFFQSLGWKVKALLIFLRVWIVYVRVRNRRRRELVNANKVSTLFAVTRPLCVYIHLLRSSLGTLRRHYL